MILKKTKFSEIALTALLAATVALTVSCGGEDLPVGGDVSDDSTSNDLFDVETVEPDTAEDTTADTTEDTSDDTTEDTSEDTTADTEYIDLNEPDIINPLTGLAAEVDYESRRPLAIMINNIKVATPQEGISYADIMYECIVEGYQTRLMMLVSDYENLPVVGSVRSSREYYLDFAANHNAIYMHAGGSNQAYAEIGTRRVNNLDGVNDSGVSYRAFYRDQWRLNNMGYEHSLMTTGEGIVKALDYKKYDTNLKEDFDSPLDFVPYDTVRIPEGGNATYLKVKYSYAHHPYFSYDANDGVYYRWQFNGDKHIDNTAGVQLSFTNVIVLYCPTRQTGDSYGHVDVTTTGEGEGYYLTQGKYEKITWVKTGDDVPVKLYNEAGEALRINRGKTFFQVCTTEMKDTTEIK